MQQPLPSNDMIRSTAERILKFLPPEDSPASAGLSGTGSPSPEAEGSPAKREEITPWDIKMNLHLSSSMLYLALGWLCSRGQVTLEPYELTYRVRQSGATAAPSPKAEGSPASAGLSGTGSPSPKAEGSPASAGLSGTGSPSPKAEGSPASAGLSGTGSPSPKAEGSPCCEAGASPQTRHETQPIG